MEPRAHAASASATPRSAPPGTVHRALDARASSDPDALAILAPDRPPLTTAALAGRIGGIRQALNEEGLGRRDRVAVVAGLGAESAVAVLGVACGACCVPLHPAAGTELDALLSQTRVRAMLAPGEADAVSRAAAERHGLVLLEGVLADGEAARPALSDPDHAGREEPAPPTGGDLALLLRTSGTASRPKLVPVTHHELLARASKAGRLLGVGDGDRCLSPMPLSYAHGLYSGLFMPLLSGGASILPPSFEEESFLRCLEELEPSWYTAGATHHQAILRWLRRRGPRGVRHQLRFARSGAAALSAAALEDLEDRLGVPILETYSASETGIISSNRPAARRGGTVGIPPKGEVAVVDAAGEPSPTGTAGEIVVRGPTVFSGYEDEPQRNAHALRNGWFHTGDLGSLSSDGFLTLLGRIDEIINRGGEKVSPAEIEAALRAHPAVAEALGFPVPHASLGEDVAAAVILEAGAEAGEAELRRHVGERLSRFKVPERIVTVDQIPVGMTGKPLRSGLAEQLGLVPAPGTTDGPPPNPLTGLLIGLWGEALELDAVGPDDDFFALGGDSLSAIELSAAIEAELQTKLELEDLLEAPTPSALAAQLTRAEYLDRRRARSGPREVVGVNTAGANAPLFVVAGRPGYVMRAMLVGRALGADQPVYGLQPPGMDWGARGIRTVREMATHYLTVVRTHGTAGKHRLLGVSFGGLVVHEMARQLERAGEEVEFLGLVDTEPATCQWDGRTHSQPAAVHESDEEVRAEARPGRISESGTRVAAAHVEGRRAHVIDYRIACDLTLFYCAGEGVAAAGDRRRLWAESTRGRFRLLALPGLHAKISEEPQFSALTRALLSCLSGDPPAGLEPAEVFGRSFSLRRQAGAESITSGDGVTFRVEKGAMHGRVRAVRSARGRLMVRGWASDAERRQAGGTIVAFVGGRFAAYSTCGVPSPRLEQRHSAPGLRYAGFRLRLDLPADAIDSDRPRVFALSPDGRATELGFAR